MKTKLVTLVFALFLFGSCASLFPKTSSDFTPDKVELGMFKIDFLNQFGKPYKQNFFYNDADKYCEVLFYRERVIVGNSWMDMDTIFTFVEGKLVSQEQVEILGYRDRCRDSHLGYHKEIDSEDE